MKKKYERQLTAAELAGAPDEDVDTTDIPDLGADFWKAARVVMPEERGKAQITARFDIDVVRWFKAQGRGYQARMNAVLRSYFEAHRD